MSNEIHGKVGQRVEHFNFGWKGVIINNVINSCGKITIDYSEDTVALKIHRRNSLKKWTSEPCYVNILSTSESISVENTDNSWSFKTTALAAVDWTRMENDLTNATPLLSLNLAMANGLEMPLIMVQRELLFKAEACKIKSPAKKADWFDGEGGNIFLVRNHVAEWVNWAKKVRAAAWPENMRCNSVITAQLLSV